MEKSGNLSVRKSGNPALVIEPRRVTQSLAQYYIIGNTCTELDRFTVKFDTCINFKLGVIFIVFFCFFWKKYNRVNENLSEYNEVSTLSKFFMGNLNCLEGEG